MGISLKIKAEELGKSLKELSDRVEGELKQAVNDLAHAAYSNIVAKVQSKKMSPNNRSSYLNSLKFNKIGEDSYIISLEKTWPEKLEKGFASYNMKDTLLQSTKRVSVGSRAGEPWVRTSKAGNKYASVPLQKRMSGSTLSGDMENDIKNLLSKTINGRQQKLSEVVKNTEGNYIKGKVATTVEEHPVFGKFNRYQHVSDSGKVSSIFIAYKTISELSSGWVHPGHKGYNFFDETEKWVETQLDNIIKTLIP